MHWDRWNGLRARDFFILLMLIVVSTIFSVSGFATPDATAQSGKTGDEGYIVKLGYYNCDHMTAAPVAKEAGIFDQLGLKVEVIGNAKVPEAMAAGQMDVGYIGFERVVRAYIKGCPIFISAMNHLGGSYYLVLRNDIYEQYKKDPKSLLKRKLALGTDPEKNSPEWVTFAKKVGLPVEGKNYEVFNMSDKDEFLALKTGSLDGYMTCDPWGSMAEHDKCGHIVPEFTATRMPTGKWGVCCVLSMNRNFTEAHPEIAKKMILAHTKAIQFIYTHPLRAAEIFSKSYSVPLEVALMTIFKKTVEEDRTMQWDISSDNVKEAVNWNLDAKTLEGAAAIQDYVDTSFLQQAGPDNFERFIKEKVDPVFPLGMSYDAWKKKAYEIEGKTLQAAL
ncbi:MAG: ABC transporter substrate-binding subunit SaoX [Syntrophobacteraceae bacterium]